MRRLAVAAAASVVAALAGCGVATEGSPTVADDGSVPFSLLETPTTATTLTPEVPAVEVEVCFHEADRVVPVTRRSRSASLAALVDIYIDGPTADERRRGVTTALFDESVVEEVTSAGGIATVVLSPEFTEPGTPARDIVAEIVCTFTRRSGIGQVAFEVDDEPIAVPKADGSLATDPVSRDDYASLFG
jgi:spore germination protein GerM